MSTAAQITANRRNATRSTGPRTPQGKAASAANSTRHGLTGEFRLLPGEDPAEFQELLDDYWADFEPTTDHESFLVHQIAQARWKLDRILRLESEAFDQILAAGDQQQSSDARIVTALSAKSCIFDRLERYAAQARRVYNQAHGELTRLQRQRAKDHAAALDAQLLRMLHAPMPDSPHFDSYRSLLQNEANSTLPAPPHRPSRNPAPPECVLK